MEGSFYFKRNGPAARCSYIGSEILHLRGKAGYGDLSGAVEVYGINIGIFFTHFLNLSGCEFYNSSHKGIKLFGLLLHQLTALTDQTKTGLIVKSSADYSCSDFTERKTGSRAGGKVFFHKVFHQDICCRQLHRKKAGLCVFGFLQFVFRAVKTLGRRTGTDPVT